MHVYLAMPTESERVDILGKLLLKMGASPDIDVAPLAARTQGFSGADLQALMYNAQLHVAHDALDRIEARPQNDGEEVVKVATGVNAAAQPALTMRDIEKAMTETRASLSDKERMRLENIYAEFGPREPAGDGAGEVGKWRKAAGRKATLA
jgi:SpoVK/Ycf46/Vps4 family AAA+-type ATPase